MTNPAAFAVERPRVVVLATLFAFVYGFLTYAGMARQENPTITQRWVAVWTYLPGAEPEKVELLVSKVLEDKISEVDDIHTIFSNSVEGASFLQVELKKDAPVVERIQQIRLKIQEARLLLPPGASNPKVDDRVLRTNTMVLALTSATIPPVTLKEHAKTLQRRLEALPTVAKVELTGAAREEVEVAVDIDALAHRGIPLTDVLEALAERNTLLPGGELELGAVRSPIRASGAYNVVHDLSTTHLRTSSAGAPVRVGDVAAVRRGLAEDQVWVRWNGISAVAVALEMLPGHNAVALGERVRAMVDAFVDEVGGDLDVHVVADEPYYVERRITDLTDSLLMGLSLVIVFTFIGLGWRSGLVVSATIPLVLVIALGLMGTLGVPLHQISIAALVIAIGLVVDESIVVVDNIQRHIEMGTAPRRAAVDGLGEIHLAVLAGVATTIAAFVPLMLMSGDIGDFVRSIPIAVTLMLLGSALVAHFFTPLLTAFVSGWNRARDTRRNAVHRFEPAYARLLELVVARTGWVLALFVAAFFVTVVGIGRFLWPPDFFSDADRPQFLLELYLPSGAAVEETDAVARRVEDFLAADPAVRDWTAFVGAGAPKFYYNQFTEREGENIGSFIINTADEVSRFETRGVAERVGDAVQRLAPGAYVRAVTLRQGYGGGSDIEMYIQGDDLDVLRSLAARVRDIARQVDGVTATYDSFGYDPITIEARVDADRASLLGISHRDVASTLRTALDGTVATTFRDDDEEIPVVVRVPRQQRNDLGDLSAMPLVAPATGRVVPLSQIATLVPGFTTSRVMRWRREREASVSLDVSGRPLFAVGREVEKRVRAQVSMPEGYEISFYGQQEEVTESFLSLARAAVVAIFLIYIVLVVRFQSLTQPMLIILAIPMALIGSTWGLVLSGNPLSFTAFLGMISLTGIVVNDSIVLLDYINTLRRRGQTLERAVVAGATTRMRAVLLTSITTIAGLLPLSLAGGDFFGPFGFAMIGGLTASTVLTLAVQPAAYLTLERRRKRTFPTAQNGRSGITSFATDSESR